MEEYSQTWHQMEVNSKPHASTAFTSAEKVVGTRQIEGCLGPTLGVDV